MVAIHQGSLKCVYFTLKYNCGLQYFSSQVHIILTTQYNIEVLFIERCV